MEKTENSDNPRIRYRVKYLVQDDSGYWVPVPTSDPTLNYIVYAEGETMIIPRMGETVSFPSDIVTHCPTPHYRVLDVIHEVVPSAGQVAFHSIRVHVEPIEPALASDPAR
ncbi:hypothetical protein [Vreelandella olivaria]|uniref:hypothetical protein n=1 Tax=Vreelandella olivaria TaxID=390919 RepID=UPI00201E7798|nr:hypothetical protein [Halomonas olivaria]